MGILEIEKMEKGYNKSTVIKDISLSVAKGTVHGVIGENGSGKTTLIKCVTGIYEPDEGSVLFDGQGIYENPSIKSRIGYVADDNEYFPAYRIEQMADFYRSVYAGFSMDKYKELSHTFQLNQETKIHSLSKGQKMRLAFVLNMSLMPELLVLDEPTAGLDALAKHELLDCIIREVEEREMTVFISSHHLGELEKLCDTVSILHMGRIRYQDSVDDIKKKVRKYQAVFPDLSPAKAEALRQRISMQQAVLDVTKVGSIFTVAAEDAEGALYNWLRMEGAEWVEEIEIGLEELFLFTGRSVLGKAGKS